jgi:hypothetical protein
MNIFSKASRACSSRPERARASTYQNVQIEKVPHGPVAPISHRPGRARPAGPGRSCRRRRTDHKVRAAVFRRRVTQPGR